MLNQAEGMGLDDSNKSNLSGLRALYQANHLVKTK